MRSLQFLTFYLIAISAFVLGHVLAKSHPQLRLIARGSRGTQFSDDQRPRPVGIHDAGDLVNGGTGYIEGVVKVVDVVRGKPGFVRETVLPNGKPLAKGAKGVIRQAPGYNEVWWGRDTAAVAEGTKALQEAFKSSQGVRFSNPKRKAASDDRRRAVIRRYETARGQESQNADEQSVVKLQRESPLDRLVTKVFILSYHEAASRIAAMSKLRQIGDYPSEEDANPSGTTTTYFNNLDQNDKVLPTYPLPNTHGDMALPLPGSQGRPGVIGVSPQQYGKDIGSNSDYKSRKRIKRNSALDTLTDTASSGDTNSVSMSAQFQMYQAAYRSVQSNISDILFPFLDEILAGTNSSLAYNMAWSIWADLTGQPFHVVSPFSNGMNCLDWIEEAWTNQTNANATAAHGANATMLTTNGTYVNGTNDLPMLEFLATSMTLLELYEYAWYKASAAANKTGLLQDLATLSGYLLPTDTSIMSPGFQDPVNVYRQDLSYFTVYNRTMNHNTTIPGLRD